MTATLGLATALCTSPAAAQSAAAGPRGKLTELETAWLVDAAPVLAFARASGLPLDVVVQPRSRRGDAPIAMGHVDGRCKLVLTLRGNPDAGTLLEGVDPARTALLRETMAAHEIGHCWRHVHSAWHTLPAGFVDSSAEADSATSASPAFSLRSMRLTRREEGFADLVGLAWTAARHPAHYAWVHAWFMQVRDEPELPGSHHHTSAWLRLAPTRGVFEPGLSPFEQAHALWQRGLLEDD